MTLRLTRRSPGSQPKGRAHTEAEDGDAEQPCALGAERVSRREANKARTRQALSQAAMELLRRDGYDALTAEKVADAAGISRRTFFNYFPSVEALFAAQTQGVLEDIQRALAARPAEEDIVDGAKAVIDELFTIETLDDAVKSWRVMDDNPAVTRFDLEANAVVVADLAATWAMGRLRAQGRSADALRVNVISASFIAAFDVARRAWMTDHTGAIDTAARDEFVERICQALDYLRPAVDVV